MQDESNLGELLTIEHLSVGLQWLDLVSIETRWGLTHRDKLKLLGDISDIEYISLCALNEKNELDKLSIPVLERIVLLIRIAACLAALLGDEHCYDAFKRININPIFNSLSIKDFLLNSQSFESYYIALRYLENAIYQ
jgi:hypothetical protein